MTWKGEKFRHQLASRGIKSRRDRYDSGRAKNLKMNDDVYKLRREAMKYIYEARELAELPRINIRITDKMEGSKPNTQVLGLAGMDRTNIIWIPEQTLKEGWDLRAIVFHEILHTVFGIDHVNDPNDIMYPALKKQTKSELNKQFKKWVKYAGGTVK